MNNRRNRFGSPLPPQRSLDYGVERAAYSHRGMFLPQPMFRQSRSLGDGSMFHGRDFGDPWNSHEERRVGIPITTPGFPAQSPPPPPPPPPPPSQIIFPRLGQRIPTYPPEFVAPHAGSQHEESTLTEEEQDEALKKLKKEVYNPTPKRLARRLSRYFRDQNRNESSQKHKEADDSEDGQRCTVCLENFEARETVTVTPCNHMFHEDCIVPWVTSHGKCPVCRFAISNRATKKASPARVGPGDARDGTEFFGMDLRALLSLPGDAFVLDPLLR